METINLILDLDGVLITTPPWKPDEILEDDYSKFNEECVQNLNLILDQFPITIWLSSTRRINKTLDEFNEIFKTRKIAKPITGFLPNIPDLKTRQLEIEAFINQKQFKSFLIIDDDKTLGGIKDSIKTYLVHTTLLQGLNKEKLEEAIEKLTLTQA